jgi:hypothetical protein
VTDEIASVLEAAISYLPGSDDMAGPAGRCLRSPVSQENQEPKAVKSYLLNMYDKSGIRRKRDSGRWRGPRTDSSSAARDQLTPL